jgi:DNA polymerase III subunit gamma/tau
VMLRTFDQVNYRQEQRFHLELGLLKLVHLQRLLPVEQLLSGIPITGKGPTGGGGAHASGGTGISRTSTVLAPMSTPATAPIASRSAVENASVSMPQPPVPFSPFATGSGREAESVKPATLPRPGAGPRALTPLEATAAVLEPAASVFSIGTEIAASGVPAPVFEAVQDLNIDRLRDAVCAALDAAGHNTAAVLLANGAWSWKSNGVQVEVGVKKTMLGLTMNPEAEKIVKSVTRETGFSGPFTVVSAMNGGSENGATPVSAKRPPAGSLQAEALAHPLVKQALELFNGEVRSVLDLREKRNS